MNWREFLKPTAFKIIAFIIIFVFFVPFIHYDTGIICVKAPCPTDVTGSILMYLYSNNLIYGIIYDNLIIGLIISYLISCTLKSIFILFLTISSCEWETKMDNRGELLKYVIAGAMGFSIGVFCYYSYSLDYRTPFIPAFTREVFGSASFGATFCGLLLGIASRDVVKGIKMAIGGMIGFTVGYMLLRPFFFNRCFTNWRSRDLSVFGPLYNISINRHHWELILWDCSDG